MSSQYMFEPSTNGKVCLETSLGPIDIELWSKEAPKACRNFIQLCMENYYDGCQFHTDCVTQTGDPTNTGEGGQSIYEQDFKVESHQRLKFNRRGLVAMAGSPDGYNASQFFITLGSTPELNMKHTLFGKITGNTIFNLMNINEAPVDSDNRPERPEKINSTRILANPFDDIVPRRIGHDKRKEKKKNKDTHRESNLQTTKNTALLSFGDEMEEDEQPMIFGKPKSAHDVLDDKQLSKVAAVQPEELGLHKDSDPEDNSGKLSRVKQKLEKRKRAHDLEESKDEGDNVDFEDALETQKKSEQQAEIDRLAAESKALQKEYLRSIRGPKAKADPNDDSRLSEGMKSYKKLKLSFKSKTENVVTSVDPQREDQTMSLLNRFQTTMRRASVQGVLAGKNVDTSDLPTIRELLKANAVPKKRKIPVDMLPRNDDEEEIIIDTIPEEIKPEFDEEATDEKDPDWMGGIFSDRT